MASDGLSVAYRCKPVSPAVFWCTLRSLGSCRNSCIGTTATWPSLAAQAASGGQALVGVDGAWETASSKQELTFVGIFGLKFRLEVGLEGESSAESVCLARSNVPPPNPVTRITILLTLY